MGGCMHGVRAAARLGAGSGRLSKCGLGWWSCITPGSIARSAFWPLMSSPSPAPRRVSCGRRSKTVTW